MSSIHEKAMTRRQGSTSDSSQPMLSVEQLAIDFRSENGLVHAVHDASFTIMDNETFALVGESGSGKTVTALSILRLLPKQVTYPRGRIAFTGVDMLSADQASIQRLRGGEIGMIFQEPMTSLNPLHKIEKQIAETLILHQQMNKAEARERVIELLQMVRIEDPETRLFSYPHQLSGGQRQRVMIAMALANSPRLLIADEPTTALDVTVQHEILKLLKQLQAQLGMAILLITHDLTMVKRIADRVAVMQNGSIVECDTCQRIFSAPQHSYTRNLLSTTSAAKTYSGRKGAPVLLEVQSLRVRFPIRRGVFRRALGYLDAVEDISFSLYSGMTLGIVGESGSGKSTLAKAILRLLQSNGRITFKGKPLPSKSGEELRRLRRAIQVVFQDPYGSLSPRMTVQQIILEGLLAHDLGDTASRKARVDQVLAEVGLDANLQHRYPHEFSGGQRQRIALARALALEPELVILDEPTSALDRSSQLQIIELLLKLQQERHLTYIFISHDLRVVQALCDEILVMRQGKLVEYSSADQVFNQPSQEYTRLLVSAARH